MKKTTNTLIIAICGLFIGASALACGFADEESEYSCCVNGAFYDCDDADEFDSCNLSDGANKCSRDSSRDDEC